MTKDEALKMALEVMRNQGDVSVDEWIATEKAIKEALANEALDKMAENARELGLDYEPDDGPLTDQQIEQVKKLAENKPVAWTRTDVYAPIVSEEMMQKHPELRQYYPTPLYYAPQEWYIVEKWVAGEKRSHIRRGESLDAVYNEEIEKGVDVINVITV